MAERPRLSAEAKLQKTYIEGRDELFETKVLKIRPGEKNVLIFSRDPGSAAAIIPVLKLLPDSIGVSAVVDGWSEGSFRTAFAGSEDVTPKESALLVRDAVPHPDLILTDTSSSDMGLETFAAATFPEVPIVLIEDYYSTANKYLARVHEMSPQHAPQKICVMDAAARDIVLAQFPDLKDRIVITGQPAFDRFSSEATKDVRANVRAQLGLTKHEKLVTYLGTGAGQIDEIRAIVPKLQLLSEEMRKRSETLVVCFRKHPRDNTSAETYAALFRDHGIAEPTTNAIPTNDMAAASDAVLTSWSTGGLDAAFRRIPTLYINDTTVRKPPANLEYPLPPVRLGASLSATQLDNVPHLLEIALNPDDATTRDLRVAMEEHYKTDGQNAQRVADVVRSALTG